jgi:hypothetical protein
MDFLPTDYKEAVRFGNYSRLEEGENVFRILDSAVVGYEWWVDDVNDEGKPTRKPVRVRTYEEIKHSPDVKDKHFWAFPVWNYKANKVQVLEITQTSIRQAIKVLVDNPKWGSPLDYDVVITKTKTGSNDYDVDYTVQPNPKEVFPANLYADFQIMGVNLEALFDGNDPFESINTARKLEIDPKHLPTKDDKEVSVDEALEALKD